MLFQPIFNKMIAKGLVAQFSPIINFDWKNDDIIVPISFGNTKIFCNKFKCNFHA
jgi:hypothetical protein